jgi:hypothetical protein
VSSEPITSERELREELDAVVDRAQERAFMRGSGDEPTESVPSEDEPWSTADVLGGMMAGTYAHGACVEVFGYRLNNSSIDGTMPNVWTVHPPENADGAAAIDALNLDQFATASAVEDYLLEGQRQGETDG